LFDSELLEKGKQKFGILFNQSLQSIRRIENESIKAAMAMVDGANNNEEGTEEKKEKKIRERIRYQIMLIKKFPYLIT
jgi:hypothetical protein